MRDIDPKDVERRARENCEQDGFDWQVAARAPAHRFAPLPTRQALDKANRDQYLTHAKEQLERERRRDA